MDYSSVTVIIPTLNESENVGELIRTITGTYPGIKITVADDGSTDGTGKIVRAIGKANGKVKLLDRSASGVHGITASVIEAVKKSSTRNLVIMDGDFQHPPEKIGEIAGKLRNSDLVVASRKKVFGSWPFHRRMMSVTATRLARLKLRRSVSDPMSGFFGVKSRLFRDVLVAGERRFEKKGYKVLFDLLKQVPEVGLAEVRYDFLERKGGRSKMGVKHVLIMVRALFRK